MKNIIGKIAALSNYMDANGHKEEAHELDHVLHSLAEEAPGWTNPIDRVRWEIEHAGETKEHGGSVPGREMMKELESEEETFKEPADTQVETQNKSIGSVVIEATGFEPIKVKTVSQVIKLSQNSNVADEFIIAAIFNAIVPDSGKLQLQNGKTLEDAILSGVRAKVLEDDRWFWQK